MKKNFKFSVNNNAFIKKMIDPQIDPLKINSHFFIFLYLLYKLFFKMLQKICTFLFYIFVLQMKLELVQPFHVIRS